MAHPRLIEGRADAGVIYFSQSSAPYRPSLHLGLASVIAALEPEHSFRVVDFMFEADPRVKAT